jgi:hypothetical protein
LNPVELEKSPRIVPGSAFHPNVAPISWRVVSMARGPSITAATTGADVM